MEKQQRYLKEKSAHEEKVNALKVSRDTFSEQRYDIERLIQAAKSTIQLYERDAAEIKENCPTCGQKLPEAKLAELKARREQFLDGISKEKEKIKKHEGKLAEIIAQINDLNNAIAGLRLDEPEPVLLKAFDETALEAAAEKMSKIDAARIRAKLEKANEAKFRLEGLRDRLTEKVKLLDALTIVVKELTSGIDEGTSKKIRKELDDAVLAHAAFQEKYTGISAEIARLEANIQGFQRAIAEIESQEKELEALRKEMLNSIKEEAAWDLISKAFGKDGIQALELDALAPGISDIANKILESAYGDRFKIAIETTRMGGAGKKTKQIEDFVIKVIDSEDGEAVNLEDKSGGEAVWIKRAIYDAFSVIRKRNTNFAFLSCFKDEADGALDSESKTAYCRMLEAAHAESKLRHTFIITHSNEVKAMIEQRIDMEEFKSQNGKEKK
jgi:exonuclease SbcC